MFSERVQVPGVAPSGHEKFAMSGQATCVQRSASEGVMDYGVNLTDQVHKKLAEGPPDGHDCEKVLMCSGNEVYASK